MADDSIRVEYNQELAALEHLLEDVERAGDFFVSGTVEIPMPKVEVEDVGVLSFPVPSSQIAEIIGHATRAPYGRGIRKALDYLTPFALGEQKWPYQQLGGFSGDSLFPLLRRAAEKYPEKKYREILSKLPTVSNTSRMNLLRPKTSAQEDVHE
jgi:hypothetical protein